MVIFTIDKYILHTYRFLISKCTSICLYTIDESYISFVIKENNVCLHTWLINFF